MSELNQLAAIIHRERETIVARWRQQVRELPSARNLDVATLNDHIPGLLDELAEDLHANSDQSIPEALADGSPPIHGLQRLKNAFDIEEVVAEYNVLRGCIHHLADENGVNLQGQPIHIINRVFDHSIGLALKTYAMEQALEVKQRREEYLAFVAHDLRTPLYAISLAERVLQDTLSTEGISATSTRMMGALRRNVNQLEQLVSKVLEENANLQTEAGMKLVRRELDLWFLVEALTYELHPVAGSASTELTNQVPEDLLVFADAGLLRRLFQNLIANAIKYTPGGKVFIGALDLPADGVVECWVSDNGAGIHRKFLEKIFEKGESDPEDAGGTGLGLAIVKTVVEAHGGKVTTESVEGVGSTFRFTMPHRTRAATV